MDRKSFERDVRELFASSWPRRAEGDVAWGVGDDRVPLLEQSDPDVEQRDLAVAKQWRAKVFDAGLAWPSGPVEHGGLGLDRSYDEVYREVEREFDVVSQGYFIIAMHMLAPAVMEHGTDAQKADLLSKLYRGDLIACQLFSEPGAGSDLAAVQARAVREGDGWRVSGQKVWSSYAHVAEVGELLVRTDSAGPKHADLTMFLLDMRSEGVEVRPLRQMSGGSHFNEVFLNDVWIPDADRIGQPGAGWDVARTTLLSERHAVGSGEGSLVAPYALRLAQLVEHLGLSEDNAARGLVAAAHARERVLDLLPLTPAVNPAEGSISKILFGQHARLTAEAAGEVLGPRLAFDHGGWGEFAWAEYVLSTPALRIAGGSDQIQKNILGERVLGLAREQQYA